ncbi:MAG TPA: hypothetical protein VFT45_00195 [Longimicrobium sp.]|nr:hypothetical protein [Longimicrobium sp.]
MPRQNLTLLLDSVGYGGANVGPNFSFFISSPKLTDKPIEVPKTVSHNPKKPTIFKEKVKVVDKVVDLPVGTTTLALRVKVVEKDKVKDEGEGGGEVKVQPDGTGNGFVDVKVKGAGPTEDKKTGQLHIGFLLTADSSPELIAALCRILRSVTGTYAAGVNEPLRACLLRIAWHESGALRLREQTGGPARGLYMMQANGAVDALTRMSADAAAFADFAAEGKFAGTADLEQALQELRKAGGVSFGGNRIGAALQSSDRCATLAAVYRLLPHFDGLPGIADIGATTTFWATHWRGKSTDAGNKSFTAAANQLERIRSQLPKSDCGTA